MKEFVARTDVATDLTTGWRVLTDFTLFPEWNPLLRRVNGTASLGASLGLRVAQKTGSDKTIFLPAKIRVCNPHNELAWGGGVPGLLDVHHYFRFEPTPGGFRFIHGEIFRGAILPLLWPVIGARVRQENYETLNEAFKKRCELTGVRR